MSAGTTVIGSDGPPQVQRLLQDEGIVRHRGKIEAALHNAGRAVALAKDLKKRGWAFVGPTTVFAFMQAVGLVNDHAAACVVAGRVARARQAFRVPA